MSLNVRKRTFNGICIFDLMGTLTDGEPILLLRESMRVAINAGIRNFLLNLTDVRYIDSSGLGELVACHYTARNKGGRFKLLNVTAKTKDLLQMTKLLTVFEAFNDEASAIRSFSILALYCTCPFYPNSHHRSAPARFGDEPWWPQACNSCGCRFEVETLPSKDQALVRTARIATHSDESSNYVNVISAAPFQVQIVGRISLFSSTVLAALWKVLPQLRRVVFDLKDVTEVEDDQNNSLGQLLMTSGTDARVSVSVENCRKDVKSAFSGSSLVYPTMAEARSALGDISDTPKWQIPVVLVDQRRSGES